MKHIYMEVGGKAILLSVVGAILFFILRRPIVEICFGNGAMTSENIEVFIEVLGVLIVSIPFSIIIAVSTRMLFVMRKIKVYTLLMIPCNIITCALYYCLIEKNGVNGYAMADVSMEIVKSIMLSGCTLLLLKKIKCKYED
jgi:putative peptidoglycan lipid II flippase